MNAKQAKRRRGLTSWLLRELKNASLTDLGVHNRRIIRAAKRVALDRKRWLETGTSSDRDSVDALCRVLGVEVDLEQS